MTALGITLELQSAILDPRFDDLRRTASCTTWLRETVSARWAALRALRTTLRERSRTSADDTPTGSAEQHPAGIPAAEAESTDPAPHTTTLWKALMAPAAATALDTATGAVRADELLSRPPGDATGTTPAAYVTPQRALADLQAAYLATRSRLSRVVVVEFVARLDGAARRVCVVGGGGEWRAVVGCGREMKGLLPGDRFEEVRAAGVVEVNVARRSGEGTGDWGPLWLVEGRGEGRGGGKGRRVKAVQWAFKGEDGLRAFAEGCRGRWRVHPLGTYYDGEVRGIAAE